jgi:subtilisin family serine protease
MRVMDVGSASYAKATGAGVKVGVIDGGIDLIHGDLAGHIDLGLSCSFIFSDTPTADPIEVANGDCSKKTAVQDLQGHGTHVATTIGGRLNGIGIAGVAPDATIVGLKGHAPSPASASRTRSRPRCGMPGITGSTS